ncbi:hypothetical protein VOLCADRAFT_72753 [Volvox carteri f. nagariensis]|uniref:Phosphoglycolate phosphatase n=1 Tax=Volvox carteri f. nagariensis TaxID=3068 RepID=D8TJC8_VOLCA|nr:uncharacterized protein VOLCADRAFT_72753 [Volvox carteri f. nagariensis]EFJ52521.1 hypothetical protein VOLCADRAFT_72753 [Volvox carteri f. nagariensis]|eukprot:XP_002946594.1 hypothetical protein VOLCADRAFT_72753 [Volvox carteri f. nagariensis]
MASTMNKATDQDKLAAFQNYDAWVFDLDGTIWKGSGLIPGAKEFIELLRSYQKKVFFVTNNATKSRASNASKLSALGITATTAEVYTSSFAAATYLKTIGFSKKAYVVGEQGLVDELSKAGITCVGGPEHAGKEIDWSNPEPHMEVDPEVGAVVVGLDRYINYYKLQYATTCLINDNSCMFIACNTDSRGHFSSSQEWAGAGTMVAAIIGSSEREPMLLGKPASFILDHMCATHQVPREKCIVIGDRLDTDILWGNQNRVATCCVLSGVTSEAQLLSPENKVLPKLYVDSLADFLTVKPWLPSSCLIM